MLQIQMKYPLIISWRREILVKLDSTHMVSCSGEVMKRLPYECFWDSLPMLVSVSICIRKCPGVNILKPWIRLVMRDVVADQAMHCPILVVLDIVSPVARLTTSSEQFQSFQSRHILTPLVVEFHHDPRFPRNVKVTPSVDIEHLIDLGLFDSDMLHSSQATSLAKNIREKNMKKRASTADTSRRKERRECQ